MTSLKLLRAVHSDTADFIPRDLGCLNHRT